MCDFDGYDAHLDHETERHNDERYTDDARADAECAVMDANKRWLRDNIDKIRELYADWRTAVIDAWYDHTTEDMEIPDDLPMSEMRDLMDAATHEDRQHEYQKRQGRHLGRM